MRCLVGLDDTDSSRGHCTTYLAYRIAVDLVPLVNVLPYPRLVRLNPNIPFKTRGNAAVCLQVETTDPEKAFERIRAKVSELSDVEGGANSGLVFLDDASRAASLRPLYLDALSGVVNPHRARGVLAQYGARTFELGNGMGVVGAASALAFDETFDHSYEIIAYRGSKFWGTSRPVDSASVKRMDRVTWPHTFNNYDYQKRKVLIAPHGPDPVLFGIRGDSPSVVCEAHALVSCEEPEEGHMVYLSNQHTDAHLERRLDWKVYSAGWAMGRVVSPRSGPGGHVYFSLRSGGNDHACAVYEPTGDLRRVARRLRQGDLLKVCGGVRRPTASHRAVLNVEKLEVLRLTAGPRDRLARGTYISSPRANRHLTKPLIRYGRELAGRPSEVVPEWIVSASTETKVLA